MEGIFSQEASRAKQQFQERLKWIRDAELRTRYLIVIHLLEGQSSHHFGTNAVDSRVDSNLCCPCVAYFLNCFIKGGG